MQASKWQAHAEGEVARLYPDTKMESWPGGRRVWTSTSMIGDAVDLELLDRTPVLVGVSTRVEGLAVYHPKFIDLDVVLTTLREKSPETYQAIVQTAVELLKR